MSEDERKSVYRGLGGRSEVVRLDKARATRGSTPPGAPRSSVRPKPTSRPPEAVVPPAPPAPKVEEPSPAEALVAELTALPQGPVDAVIPRLERMFELVAPALVEAFPGPLWSDPRRPHSEPPRGQSLCAIGACFVAMRTRSVPFVTQLLSSPRADIRFLAAFVGRELPYAPIVEALGRMSLHADPTSRLAAVTVLPFLSHASGYPALVSGLRLASETAQTREVRLYAVQALEELRDPLSVPALVSYLRDPDAELAEVARDALRTLTARVQSNFAWRRFLAKHGDEPRLLWLVDALTQWDAELRILASVELARLTGQRRVLSPRDGRAEAKALVSHYRAYWAEVSRRLGGTP